MADPRDPLRRPDAPPDESPVPAPAPGSTGASIATPIATPFVTPARASTGAPDDPLAVVAAWPVVVQACERAREACTRLRFHEGLRRRIPEAAAESRVRGAWASAALDGARVPVDVVRDLMTGAARWPEPSDATWDRVRGAVQATTEAEHVAASLGSRDSAPARALARLHLAAAAPLLGEPGPGGRSGVDLPTDLPSDLPTDLPTDLLGRPRTAADAGLARTEFATLPPPPVDVTARLEGIVAVLRAPQAPALLVAALVHAELALVRPFVGGNARVARAAERAIVRARGLDPTGVAVPEVGHAEIGPTGYLGALEAYATGTRPGIEAWVEHCGQAMLRAAAHGEVIADAVRAGRLDGSTTR